MNSLDRLQKLTDENGGHWGEHPKWTVAEWLKDAAEGNTRLGYWQWVMELERIDAEIEEKMR